MAEIRHASPLRQHWIGVVPARVRSDAVSVEEMPFLGRVLLQGDGRDRTVIDAVGKALDLRQHQILFYNLLYAGSIQTFHIMHMVYLVFSFMSLF